MLGRLVCHDKRIDKRSGGKGIVAVMPIYINKCAQRLMVMHAELTTEMKTSTG